MLLLACLKTIKYRINTRLFLCLLRDLQSKRSKKVSLKCTHQLNPKLLSARKQRPYLTSTLPSQKLLEWLFLEKMWENLMLKRKKIGGDYIYFTFCLQNYKSNTYYCVLIFIGPFSLLKSLISGEVKTATPIISFHFHFHLRLLY